MKFKSVLAAAAAMTAVVAVASPASAVTVTSVQIKSTVEVLQVAELQLFANGLNVAQGKTATATSVYVNGPAVPSFAVDGDTRGDYPFIYHGDDYNAGDILTVDLGGAFDVTTISIFGRTDSCCGFRDNYIYTLFNGATQVGTGTLDARATAFATANLAGAVPEPASWALMIGGFGMVGGALRRRKATVSFA